ncbi:unnamed protein product, partial [Ixodes pacificus]
DSNFVLGNAQVPALFPIVYCSDGFCELTGYPRAQIMQKGCACAFLYGSDTKEDAIREIDDALENKTELKLELIFYKKNGSPFWCLLDIVPIKNEKHEVVLFLASHKDITKSKMAEIETDDADETAELDANGNVDFEGCAPSNNYQRRRSRAVLYQLSGHYRHEKKMSKLKINNNLLHSTALPEYKTAAIKKSRFILSHYGAFKTCWDWLILVATVYVAVVVPYSACFGEMQVCAPATPTSVDGNRTIISDVIVEAMFIIDKMAACSGVKNMARRRTETRYCLPSVYIFFFWLVDVRFVLLRQCVSACHRLSTLSPMAALMHAVVFGNVTAIIQRMYARRSLYQTKLRDLKDFFRLHQLPKQLRQRMMDFFQTTWSLNNGIDPNDVLREFPDELLGDVSMHLHKEILSLPIFEPAPQGCLKLLSRHVRSNFCAPGEYLVHKGDALSYIHLVCNGSMEVLQESMVVAILGKGDLVGSDISLTSGAETVMRSSSDVKALTYCDLKCLFIPGLLEVLKLYPEFAESFCHDIVHDLTYNLREGYENEVKTHSM